MQNTDDWGDVILAASAESGPAISVKPHPAEIPLRVALFFFGILLWLLIIMSIVGLFYGLVFGLIFFFAHLVLVVHLRGSSVKIGPDQFPELHNRIAVLARRIGMKKMPNAYLMQSGGVLNAFATRFGWRNFIVLHSDMVRACGDNTDALDFVIAHELGHLDRGHLQWRWVKAPATIIPFLGSAYYRCCEYTCDRYGALACRDPNQKLTGLCLLAAGPQLAPRINPGAFVAQTGDLNTVMMKFGSWFGHHPPLASRAAALEPGLVPKDQNTMPATAGALLLATILLALPIGGGIWMVHTLKEEVAQQLGALKGVGDMPTTTPDQTNDPEQDQQDLMNGDEPPVPPTEKSLHIPPTR